MAAYDLSREQRQEYAAAILQRDASCFELAEAAFRKAYPDAPPEMIRAAVFHVYVDGINAARIWLAAAERFLRDPSQKLNDGDTMDLLNHLYNWHVLEALLPCGRAGLVKMLDEIEELAQAGDLEAVHGQVSLIKEMLAGNQDAPTFL
jgi:hypothetical protein